MSNIKLSPSQAGKLFGSSERSIRRAIKNREIPFLVVSSRYQIDFSDMLVWSRKFHSRERKRDTLGLGQFVEKWK